MPRLLLALLVALAVAPAACSSDRAGDRSERAAASTTTTQPPPPLTWTLTGLDANGTAPPGDDVVAAVKATLDGYLARAVVEPLRSGAPAGDLAGVLSAAALEKIADPAVRSTLVDEGLPPASRSITAETATASLSSVAGTDGTPAVIGAQLDLAIHAVGPRLDVAIVRRGEVVLVPEAGGWRIDSFVLSTQRDSRT